MKHIEMLAEVRKDIVLQFERLRDYKTNPNALMKEEQFARSLYGTILSLDKVLKEMGVKFE